MVQNLRSPLCLQFDLEEQIAEPLDNNSRTLADVGLKLGVLATFPSSVPQVNQVTGLIAVIGKPRVVATFLSFPSLL